MRFLVASAFAVALASCGGRTPTPATAGPVPASAEPDDLVLAPSTGSLWSDPPPVARALPVDIGPDVPAGDAAARDAVLVADAAAIFDAFYDGAPWLTPDAKKVVFRSNRDGIPQLYVADTAKPAAPPTRLVTSTERAAFPQVTPDGKWVVFLSDHGSDENWSIFRVGLDGTGLAELTPGETLHRDPPSIPTAAPGTMVYTARAAKEKEARLYVQPLEPGAPAKLVYTDTGSAFLLDVSPDGKNALMLRALSSSSTVALVVDLATGAARKVYPLGTKEENVRNVGYSPDGRRILLTTDEGGESAIVIALDATTLIELARYVETKPATAGIAELAVPRKGDRLALVIDAGNHSELRLLDAKTLKLVATPAMPLGSGGSARFDDAGKTLALSWSTATVPPDLWAVDAKTAKVRALRAEPRASIAKLPALDASITEVVSFDGTKVPVNLYLPKPLPPGRKLPVLVNVHGGPASSSPIRWSAFTRYFSEHGFAVVEPNIRGSTGFGRAYEMADNGAHRMDAVADVEAVGRWAIAQPWADPERLVLLGGSYGGYMTLMGVTHHPGLWKAGVDLFGVYSWRTFMTTTAGVIRDIFQVEIGPESDGEFLDAISPAAKIDEAVAPLFVYAGKNDPRVPRTESDAIVASLRARKVPVEYMVADDEGHSLDRKANITAFMARSLRFLETALALPR